MKLEIKGNMRITFHCVLILNGTAKTKLAMLAFLYRGMFVKNSISILWPIKVCRFT